MIIRPWKLGDAPQLRSMIRQFLKSQLAMGGDVLASDANVEFFLRIGLEAARRGEPSLVAEENGKILAYLEVAEQIPPYQIKERMLMMWGMFTLPSHRSQFLNVQLLREAAELCRKQKKFKRGTSIVYLQNRRVLETMFYGDTWPVSVILEWRMDAESEWTGSDYEWRPREEK